MDPIEEANREFGSRSREPVSHGPFNSMIAGVAIFLGGLYARDLWYGWVAMGAGVMLAGVGFILCVFALNHPRGRPR